MSKNVFVALVAILVLPLTLSAKKPKPWVLIENGYFSFELPEGFKKVPSEGVDSFVERYESDGIDLHFTYGRSASEFTGWRPSETKFEELTVDGRRAHIGTRKANPERKYPIDSQISINSAKRYGKLSVFASCRSEKEVATARKIFMSIRFKVKEL